MVNHANLAFAANGVESFEGGVDFFQYAEDPKSGEQSESSEGLRFVRTDFLAIDRDLISESENIARRECPHFVSFKLVWKIAKYR
jgi:hypothetical protein